SRPSRKSRTQPPTQNAAKPAAWKRRTIWVAMSRGVAVTDLRFTIYDLRARALISGLIGFNARPHPGPLPRGGGESFAASIAFVVAVLLRSPNALHVLHASFDFLGFER